MMDLRRHQTSLMEVLLFCTLIQRFMNLSSYRFKVQKYKIIYYITSMISKRRRKNFFPALYKVYIELLRLTNHINCKPAHCFVPRCIVSCALYNFAPNFKLRHHIMITRDCRNPSRVICSSRLAPFSCSCRFSVVNEQCLISRAIF